MDIIVCAYILFFINIFSLLYNNILKLMFTSSMIFMLMVSIYLYIYIYINFYLIIIIHLFYFYKTVLILYPQYIFIYSCLRLYL